VTPTPVVYFDGVCGLCNRFVDFLLEHDPSRRLRFAPIQGPTAASRLPGTATEPPATIVLEEDGRFWYRSAAVLRILHHLGGGWRLTAVARVIPRPLRDLVYDWIARHRYRWFGKRDSCRMPTPEERELFLP
jgi:predicted DCC family thiol-disulfide oxidoreductase YuxK